jgi:hypothetical protein
MEIAIKYTNIKPTDIHFKNIENNKIIRNADFIKLIYNNTQNEMYLYNINIISNNLKIENPIINFFNFKKNINIQHLFIPRNNTNNSFIEFIEKTDSFFEKKIKNYSNSNNINLDNKKYISVIKKNDNNGIVLRMPINFNDIINNNIDGNSYQIILRWNGIWITDIQYGLNYKILKIIKKN